MTRKQPITPPEFYEEMMNAYMSVTGQWSSEGLIAMQKVYHIVRDKVIEEELQNLDEARESESWLNKVRLKNWGIGR
jgi:hypothetical protein